MPPTRMMSHRSRRMSHAQRVGLLVVATGGVAVEGLHAHGRYTCDISTPAQRAASDCDGSSNLRLRGGLLNSNDVLKKVLLNSKGGVLNSKNGGGVENLKNGGGVPDSKSGNHEGANRGAITPQTVLKSVGSASNGVLKSFKSFGRPAPPPPPRKATLGEILPFTATEGVFAAVILLVTHLARPGAIQPLVAPQTPQHVFYFGWVAALSSGLGPVTLLCPLFFLKRKVLRAAISETLAVSKKRWLAVCNALAGGIMLSAAYHLIEQSLNLDSDSSICLSFGPLNPGFSLSVSHPERCLFGFATGLCFVVAAKSWLVATELADEDGFVASQLSTGKLQGKHLRKVLLMLLVMVLHSCSQGLGIAISFTGKDGVRFGSMITSSLALHNIHEGLAIALVIAPRGITQFATVLWAIYTSVPQAVVAVPVFVFAEKYFLFGNEAKKYFLFWQSIGLGFAAGSMFWVTATELLSDAIEDLSILKTALLTSTAFATGHVLHYMVPEPS